MSKIEWTHTPDGKGGRKKGETINPQIGCREKSAGCRNCYAAKQAHLHAKSIPQHAGLTVVRTNGVHWNGQIRRVPEQLIKPLRWRASRGIFWGSMTDLFIEDNETEEGRRFIAACFGVMAATPQHTHMVLTKRPDVMRRWFEWVDEASGDSPDMSIAEWCMHEAWALLTGMDGTKHLVDAIAAAVMGDAPSWPLPNVWLGTSVEDQAAANERIPELLRVPATVRFLSCEPLLGPVDLGKWLAPVDRCGDCEAERPARFEDQCDECGKTGTIITTWGNEQLDRLRSGERYADDDPHAEGGPQIHWVITGGESGPGARPMHPQWARDIIDQCVAAGVPAFHKQNGEFAPWVTEKWFTHGGAEKHAHTWIAQDGSHGDCWIYDGDGSWVNWIGDPPETGVAILSRVGKKNAGRVLDGRTWDQFPEVK